MYTPEDIAKELPSSLKRLADLPEFKRFVIRLNDFIDNTNDDFGIYGVSMLFMAGLLLHNQAEEELYCSELATISVTDLLEEGDFDEDYD